MHCTHIRVAASFLGKVGEDATTKHAIHSELEIDSTPAARERKKGRKDSGKCGGDRISARRLIHVMNDKRAYTTPRVSSNGRREEKLVFFLKECWRGMWPDRRKMMNRVWALIWLHAGNRQQRTVWLTPIRHGNHHQRLHSLSLSRVCAMYKHYAAGRFPLLCSASRAFFSFFSLAHPWVQSPIGRMPIYRALDPSSRVNWSPGFRDKSIRRKKKWTPARCCCCRTERERRGLALWQWSNSHDVTWTTLTSLLLLSGIETKRRPKRERERPTARKREAKWEEKHFCPKWEPVKKKKKKKKKIREKGLPFQYGSHPSSRPGYDLTVATLASLRARTQQHAAAKRWSRRIRPFKGPAIGGSITWPFSLM